MANPKDLPIPDPVIDDGGPAFPLVCDDCVRGGMTLRDYFAAKAMAGFLASPTTPEKATAKQIADVAYGMADAMLAARKGGGA